MTTPTLTPDPDTETITAEEATVGALLLAADSLRTSALEILCDNDFQDRRCRFTASTVRRMMTDRVPVDLVTTLAYIDRHGLLADGSLRGPFSVWLADRCSLVPSPAALRWYALTVVEDSIRRQIAESGARLCTADRVAVVSLPEIISTEVAALASLSDRLRVVGVDG